MHAIPIPPLIKRVGLSLLGPALAGELSYYRSPELRSSWGGPFNGQKARQELFADILKAIPIETIVETGTYRGTTTEHLCTISKAPVFTVEQDRRYYGYSRARLRRFRNVKLANSDSRAFVAKIIRSRKLGSKSTFFYLDAHWGDDLPLNQELETIFLETSRSIVMIDDFAVPHDPSYGYDSYGDTVLSTDLISAIVARYRLGEYYPATRASEETGMRRGCVVLAGDEEHIQSLDRLSSLQRLRRAVS